MEEHQLHAASTVTSTQQELEEDLDGSCGSTWDIDLLFENAIRTMMEFEDKAKYAIRTMMEFEEKAKYFKQRLLQQQMRRHDIKNQYSDHHPRKKVAEEQSVPPSTINDERPCQTHTHRPKLRLCFNGSLKSTIYTNKPLLGQSNGGIEIAIFEDDRIITSGRLASLSLEIVALEKEHSCKGEWTGEDFDRQIRKSRDGQGSVLEGERLLKLVNGKASLGNIRFKESSTLTRSREFVLAARVCRTESIRVEEAFMHPSFTVLVERSKGNEKSSRPKLADKVYTLKGIARKGTYAKRLEKANIRTVKDFLKALNKDRHELHEILQIKVPAFWETMVAHAMECDLSDEPCLRSYKVEGKNISLFFNCVDGLVGAEFISGVFVAVDMFDSKQKAFVDAQLEQARSKLDEISGDYVLENNYPVKILTNIVDPGSSHQSTLQGLAQNGMPNPKGYTMCHVDTMNKECTQPNTMPGCSFEGSFAVVSTPTCFPRPCGTSNYSDNVMESNHAVTTLLGARLQNAFGNEATCQGQCTASVENMTTLSSGIDCAIAPGHPLGDANLNTAGEGSSELSHPNHRNGHTNQDIGQKDMPNPKGYAICNADTMDKEWQPNRMPGCSSEGIFSVMGTPSRFPGACGTSSYTDYPMKSNNAVTTLLGASSQNALGNEVTFQAESMRTLSSGIDCATPCHPPGDANLNPAGQSSSELPGANSCNGHANQGLGQYDMPNPKGYTICNADTMDNEWPPNTMPGCSSEGTFAVVGKTFHFPQACGTSNSSDYIMESNHADPTLLGMSSQNASGNQATGQAENMRALGSGIDCVSGLSFGDANCHTGEHGPSGPFHPDHCNGHVNQALGEGRVMMALDSPMAFEEYDNMDDTFESLVRTFDAQGTLVFCQQGSDEAPNDVPFGPERVADPSLVMPDQDNL